MLLDIENVMAEYDDLMHKLFETLIMINDEEALPAISYYLKKIKQIPKDGNPNIISYNYPFTGLINPFDKNIKAVDECKKLIYDLKNIGYHNEDLNDIVLRLLQCEKKALIIFCKYYVPRNRQCEWLLFAENKINQRNLLKAIAYNFYLTANIDNYELVLYNIFNTNLNDKYKVAVTQALLDYHYDNKKLSKTILNILQIKR